MQTPKVPSNTTVQPSLLQASRSGREADATKCPKEGVASDRCRMDVITGTLSDKCCVKSNRQMLLCTKQIQREAVAVLWAARIAAEESHIHCMLHPTNAVLHQACAV